ncbi:MAG: hypothetical protein WA751_04100 [Candidatus Dormiibacterota bacterium]
MPVPADDVQLAKMLGLADDGDGGVAAEPQTSGSPLGLADPPAPTGLSRRAWLIAGVVLLVAIVFYMVVASTAGNS